jgi:hypothetical protein
MLVQVRNTNHNERIRSRSRSRKKRAAVKTHFSAALLTFPLPVADFSASRGARGNLVLSRSGSDFFPIVNVSKGPESRPLSLSSRRAMARNGANSLELAPFLSVSRRNIQHDTPPRLSGLSETALVEKVPMLLIYNV